MYYSLLVPLDIRVTILIDTSETNHTNTYNIYSYKSLTVL